MTSIANEKQRAEMTALGEQIVALGRAQASKFVPADAPADVLSTNTMLAVINAVFVVTATEDLPGFVHGVGVALGQLAAEIEARGEDLEGFNAAVDHGFEIGSQRVRRILTCEGRA